MAHSARSVESNGECFGGADQTATASMITVFLDGHPYWSDEASEPIVAREIIDDYLKDGHTFLTRINGAFSIALFDRRSRELTLAVDRMGIGTMAWASDADRIAFSTSPAQVAHRPDARSEIRGQAIYEYFFFHMIPSPESVFSGVTKLRAASAVTFNRSGERVWTYWKPNFDRSERPSFDELKSRLHQSLRGAVESHYAGPTTGAFLSGGLDSSTVTGYLSEVGAKPVQTFSIGFALERYDELEYARLTNTHFGSVGHEYYVTPQDILKAIPVVASSFDEPFGNSSAIPTYRCAQYAKSLGMNRLLAGDGGDEIFAGNERYAKQQVFELFNRIPAVVRAPVRKVVRRLIDIENPIVVLRKLRSYIDQASIELPERYENWNFAYREGPSLMFRDDFMHAIDKARPLHHMIEVYASTPSDDLLDHMLYYDWKFTLADNDLRKVTTMCDAAKIEVAYPMLDNRVVDVSIAVPSAQKMKGFELRSFFKQAMRGFLPNAVIQKTKHGFGMPFGQWLKTDVALAEMIYGSLSDLKSRSIVRSSFIDQLIEDHRHGSPSYYGFVIWDLVILEEWFKHQSAMAHTIERMSSRGA